MTEPTDKCIFEVNIPLRITESDIENIIVTALESDAISYWAGVWVGTIPMKEKPREVPLSEWCTKLLLEGRVITLYDTEDCEDIWNLNLTKLQKGIELFIQTYRDKTDPEDWDGDDVDNIIQLALFGEIVYC